MKAFIRHLISFLIIAMLLGSFAGEALAAAEDNDAPLLTSVRILDESVTAGEDIRVEISVNESVSGLEKVALQLNHWPDDQIGLLAEQVWSVPQFTTDNGSFVFTITVPTESTTADGQWYIGSLELYDARGNFNRYYGDHMTDIVASAGFDHKGVNVVSPSPHAEVSGSAAGAAPVLDKIGIRNNTVEKNGTLLIETTVTCGDYVSYIQFDFMNDSENKTFTEIYDVELAEKGTKTYQAKIPVDSKICSGEWRIWNVVLSDLSGQQTWYTTEGYDDNLLRNIDTGEVVSQTPVFTVTGEDGDITDPQIVSVRVLNEGQKLRKPDTLIVEVEILEEDSGVTNLEFETECISGRDIDNKSRVFRRFSAKGYSYRDHPDKRDSRERTEEFFDQPLKTGKYEFRIPIPETVKNGDYAVYITEIWDAEDNRRLCYSMQESITAKFSVSADAPVSVEVLSTDENMLSAIARIGEGESGVILFDGDEDPILPREALDQIAGKDKTLICDFGEYQWVVDGIDLRADKTADIDLTSEIRETELKTIKNPQKVLKVSLAEEKELPAAVQLRIKTSFVKNHFDLERGLLLYSVQAKADGGAGYETVPRKESNIQVAADNGEFWCLMDLGKGGEYFLAKEAVEMLTVDDITVAECPEFVYNGEPVCPQPQIGLNGRSMVLGQDYSLSYHNNTMSGTATMILECIGDYAHLGSNEISFVINPAAPVIRIARGGIRCARVKWEKSPEKVDGYEVQISESAEMESPRTVSLRRRRAKTLRKLNGDETYYVRIRAWKKVENKVYYSAWTSAEAITTK